MKIKEFMMHSLSELLEPGESLMYPVYGVINQGNQQLFGFLGLTDTHLLVAIMSASGKKIVQSNRISLEISSVKIKQTWIFRQCVLDIKFTNGMSCKFTFSPRVLMIDTQKDNLPLFLNYVSSRAVHQQTTELKDVSGCKLRWQYFNVYIWTVFSFMPGIAIFMMAAESEKGTLDFWGVLEMVLLSISIWFALMSPFILLSLLNRFCFGKIVGVITETGLVLENDVIPWSDIDAILYCPRVLGRTTAYKMSYTYAKVYTKGTAKAEYITEVLHFPLYGVKKIKKQHPEITIRFEKMGICVIIGIALIPTALSIVLSLLMW